MGEPTGLAWQGFPSLTRSMKVKSVIHLLRDGSTGELVLSADLKYRGLDLCLILLLPKTKAYRLLAV
jgi:hypothetical protein